MIAYIRRHERYIRESLDSHPDKESLDELLAHHDKQIAWIQQERMAHLITMMFVCLFSFVFRMDAGPFHGAVYPADGFVSDSFGRLHSSLLPSGKQRAALVRSVQRNQDETASGK